jgi:hypothetical protein
LADACKAELVRNGLEQLAPSVAHTAVELLRHVAPFLYNEREVRSIHMQFRPP